MANVLDDKAVDNNTDDFDAQACYTPQAAVSLRLVVEHVPFLTDRFATEIVPGLQAVWRDFAPAKVVRVRLEKLARRANILAGLAEEDIMWQVLVHERAETVAKMIQRYLARRPAAKELVLVARRARWVDILASLRGIDGITKLCFDGILEDYGSSIPAECFELQNVVQLRLNPNDEAHLTYQTEDDLCCRPSGPDFPLLDFLQHFPRLKFLEIGKLAAIKGVHAAKDDKVRLGLEELKLGYSFVCYSMQALAQLIDMADVRGLTLSRDVLRGTAGQDPQGNVFLQNLFDLNTCNEWIPGNLKRLELKGVSFSTVKVEIRSKAVKTVICNLLENGLESLYLERCSLGTTLSREDQQALVGSLAKSTCLQELWLKVVGVGDDFARAFDQAVRDDFPNLLLLHLSHNSIENSSPITDAFLRGVAPKLSRIYMCSEALGVPSNAHDFARFVATRPKLQVVHTSINHRSILDLLDAKGQHLPELRQLTIFCSEEVAFSGEEEQEEDDMSEMFARARNLLSSAPLQELALHTAYQGLDENLWPPLKSIPAEVQAEVQARNSTEFAHFAKAIAFSKTLVKLELATGTLGSKEFSALVRALCLAPSNRIKSLNLSCNRIGTIDGLAQILTCQNSCLNYVSLSCNRIGCKSLHKFCTEYLEFHQNQGNSLPRGILLDFERNSFLESTGLTILWLLREHLDNIILKGSYSGNRNKLELRLGIDEKRLINNDRWIRGD